MSKSSVGKNTTLHLPSKWITTAELIKSLRQTRFPRETALSIVPGSTAYRGYATSVQVAGVDVILVAKSKDDLHVAFNSITNFAPYSAGASRDTCIVSTSALELDDEL